MITWIGLCAGEIWRYLDNHQGKAYLKDLIAGIKAPEQTILMAVGWLSREGYIIIEGNLPNPLIKLNLAPPSKV
ncbi:MAG: winged helix-turn-helix domain-containing protein [Candidatus Omnitrophota bacterium]|nr:winged helix-turn-helix domain-containing protein [Candidatus Omnitrophota bacterium]